MRFVCWITEAANTHSQYVTLIVFHGKYGKAKAPPYYVIRTVPVFFFSLTLIHTEFTI